MTDLQSQSEPPASVAVQVLAAISYLLALRNKTSQSAWVETYPVRHNETDTDQLLGKADNEATDLWRGDLRLQNDIRGGPLGKGHAAHVIKRYGH